jgi:hypothetical protein
MSNGSHDRTAAAAGAAAGACLADPTAGLVTGGVGGSGPPVLAAADEIGRVLDDVGAAPLWSLSDGETS